ncbi:DUF84 family protein [Oceanobacillus halotolerans]|uniref:DUF84 family protein n=1 Tax=Oceanobacillus halotolerans TaxID=2663380 RepID=UPI0013DA5E62|nr:DUF84 family protein [Oceanobacillus halotolerans]
MKIAVGSKNPTKIQAVKAVFIQEDVFDRDAPSNVSAQPFSDEETREGAIQRAMYCAKQQESDIGIGLEGGIMYVEDQLYLCNWGALVTKDQSIYTASGARIALPKEIDDQLQNGFELGDIMDEYAHKKEVRNKEGAVGIFTNGIVTRQEMFTHVVQLLRGQMEMDELE